MTPFLRRFLTILTVVWELISVCNSSVSNSSEAQVISLGVADDALLKTQCNALCLNEFGEESRRRTRAGAVYPQFRCSTRCQQCWRSCEISSSSVEVCQELSCAGSQNAESCEKGCHYLFDLDREYRGKKGLKVWSSQLVTAVELVCQNLEGRVESPSVLANFAVRFAANQSSELLPVVHFIEAQQRIWAVEPGELRESSWFQLGKSSKRSFALKKLVASMEYRIRVLTMGVDGVMGEWVVGDWFRTLAPATPLRPPLSLSVAFSPSLRADFRWTPDPEYPSCFYHLVWMNSERIHSRTFAVDESMGYILDGLDYESNFTVKLRSVSRLKVPRLESVPAAIAFSTPSCLLVHNHNFSKCGAGFVMNLNVTVENGTGLVTWQAPQFVTRWNSVAFYVVRFRSLPHLGLCSFHTPETLFETNETNVAVGPLVDGCFYQVQVRAVSKSRRRPGKWRTEVFSFWRNRRDERSLSPESPLPFHPAFFLLVVVGFVLVVVPGVFYFVRCRREMIQKDEEMCRSNSLILDTVLHKNSIYYGQETRLGSHPDPRLTGFRSTGSQRFRCSPSASTLPKITLTDPYDPKLADVGEDSPLRFVALRKYIGTGYFSFVYKAACSATGNPSVVAVKLLKSRWKVEEFQREASMMESLPVHPHLVRYLGCCLRNAAIILEFCSGGNLKDHLTVLRQQDHQFAPDRTSVELSRYPFRKLTTFARQVASGMEYLASHGFLHGDLAARNILLMEDGSTVKISDFGQSRKIGDYLSLGGEGSRPVKWMAPEAIEQLECTPKSDVWSLGVFMWELVTLGGTPYPQVDAMEILDYLRRGQKLCIPPICCSSMPELMKDCWELEPGCRPQFAQIGQRLDVMVESHSSYTPLRNDRPEIHHTYENFVDRRF